MPANLLIALASFMLWVIFVFFRPIGLGVVHLLLVVSAVLFIRWWALRDEKRQQSTVNGQR
jgi:hypothetical protein